jgi:hypothetical protein
MSLNDLKDELSVARMIHQGYAANHQNCIPLLSLITSVKQLRIF